MSNTFRNTSQEVPAKGVFSFLKRAMKETNKYFFQVCWLINLPLILLICLFLPLWLLYIKKFGVGHVYVTVFEIYMNFSLWCFILFMVAFHLFNKTHSERQSLKFWPFMADVTWPLLVEGLKATCIIFCGFFLFVIPGIIKQIHFTFLPYVILFNRFYHQKKLKALQHSIQLSKGLGWMIFILFICIPSCVHEGVRFIVKRYFYKSDLSQYGFFEYSGLLLSLYAGSVIMIYIFSVLYFMYKEKDGKQMIYFEGT